MLNGMAQLSNSLALAHYRTCFLTALVHNFSKTSYFKIALKKRPGAIFLPAFNRPTYAVY